MSSSFQKFQDPNKEHKPGVFGSVFRGLFEGIMYYPLVRLQTIYQTADISSVKELQKSGSNGNSSFFYKNLFNQTFKGNFLNFYVGFSPFIIYYMGYKAMLSVFYPRGTGLSDIANATALSIGIGALYPFELKQIQEAHRINTSFADYNKRNLIARYGEVLSTYTKASSFTGVSAFIAKNLCISYGIVLSQLAENKLFFLALTLLATGIDNVRRNYVVQRTDGKQVTMPDVARQIVKERGFQGLARGYLLYPWLLMTLFSDLGKSKVNANKSDLQHQRYLYSR